jgi:hypothetical protein
LTTINSESIENYQLRLETSNDEIQRLRQKINDLSKQSWVKAESESKKPDSRHSLSPNTTAQSSNHSAISEQHIDIEDQIDTEDKDKKKEAKLMLEKLLNEPESIISDNNNKHLNNSQNIQPKSVDLEQQLKFRVQIEHLNELLNESELNNTRLLDQINLLKEEIRRLINFSLN